MSAPHDPPATDAYEDYWAAVDAEPTDAPARDEAAPAPADAYAEFLAIADV